MKDMHARRAMITATMMALAASALMGEGAPPELPRPSASASAKRLRSTPLEGGAEGQELRRTAGDAGGKTMSRAPSGECYERRAPVPQPGATLHEGDKELLRIHVKDEAREHARRLCGLIPYTRAQVLPCESAAVIYRLLAVINELEACRSVKARKELEAENAGLARQLSTMRREMQRWGLEYPGSAVRSLELPFGLDAPA
jgi:hypothetical protein